MLPATAAPGIERRKCDHNTPEYVLDAFREVGPIGLDPCSNPWSTVRARVELSAHRGEDGLAARWERYVLPGELVFFNPPYTTGQIPIWTAKAIDQARYVIGAGAGIVNVVPADPSTGAFRTAWDESDAGLLWGKRIPFVGGGSGNMWPSASWFWGTDELVERFLRVAAKHGITVPLRRLR